MEDKYIVPADSDQRRPERLLSLDNYRRCGAKQLAGVTTLACYGSAGLAVMIVPEFQQTMRRFAQRFSAGHRIGFLWGTRG
jgi:hypothetical protein